MIVMCKSSDVVVVESNQAAPAQAKAWHIHCLIFSTPCSDDTPVPAEVGNQTLQLTMSSLPSELLSYQMPRQSKN